MSECKEKVCSRKWFLKFLIFVPAYHLNGIKHQRSTLLRVQEENKRQGMRVVSYLKIYFRFYFRPFI